MFGFLKRFWRKVEDSTTLVLFKNEYLEISVIKRNREEFPYVFSFKRLLDGKSFTFSCEAIVDYGEKIPEEKAFDSISYVINKKLPNMCDKMILLHALQEVDIISTARNYAFLNENSGRLPIV